MIKDAILTPLKELDHLTERQDTVMNNRVIMLMYTA